MLVSVLVAIAALSESEAGWIDRIRDPVKMKKYLESFVVPPALVMNVRYQMEQSGFTCSVRTDETFGKRMHYLYCLREVEKPEHALWEVAFEIAGNGTLNGNVNVIKTFPRAPAASLP